MQINRWFSDHNEPTITIANKVRLGRAAIGLALRRYSRGLATEAAVALLRLGFEGLGLHRITGHLDARNIASARVLERAGLAREAHLVENEFVKGEWSDELVYAMLRSEWEVRQARG